MAENKKRSKVREHFAFLTYLQAISPRRQKQFIKAADRPILEALSEIALNLIRKNVTLSSSQIDKLRPFEEEIYQLSLKKHSINKKKKIAQKGGFLGKYVCVCLTDVAGSTTTIIRESILLMFFSIYMQELY